MDTTAMTEQERTEMAEMFGEDWEAVADRYGPKACHNCGTAEDISIDGSGRWICPTCLFETVGRFVGYYADGEPSYWLREQMAGR